VGQHDLLTVQFVNYNGSVSVTDIHLELVPLSVVDNFAVHIRCPTFETSSLTRERAEHFYRLRRAGSASLTSQTYQRGSYAYED
jgi:hypothetical protein